MAKRQLTPPGTVPHGKRNAKRSFWKKALRVIIWLIVAAVAYTILCRFVFPPITTFQVSSLLAGNGLERDYVPMSAISSNLKLAAIAGEDQEFPNHGGFDWKEIKKSINNPKKKRVRGAAASTITQQTAKNVFLFQGWWIFRYIRKVPEAGFTKLIEWTWGKKRILEVYLNVIEMGPGIYGAEAAAMHYYHKHASQLTRQEAARIIAGLPNPTRFNPSRSNKWVSFKTNWILRQMNNIADEADVRKLTH